MSQTDNEFQSGKQIYQIGDFIVSRARKLLFRQGKLLEPEARIIVLLDTLAEYYPQTVSRRILMDRIWPNQVISDAALAQLIRRCRKLLGDDGKSSRYIKTIHGVGFRLQLPPVQLEGEIDRYLEQTPLDTPGQPVEPEPTLSERFPAGVKLGMLPIFNDSQDDANDWVEMGLTEMVEQLLHPNPRIQLLESKAMQPYLDDLTVQSLLSPDEPVNQQGESLCQMFGLDLLVVAALQRDFLPRVLNFRIINRQGGYPLTRLEAPDVVDIANQLANQLIQFIDPAHPWRVDVRNTYTANRKANRAYGNGVQELACSEYATAEKYFRIALDLEPDFPWASSKLAASLYFQHRIDEAQSGLQRLLEFEDLDPAIAYDAQHTQANLLYSTGQLKESMQASARLLELTRQQDETLLQGNELMNIGTCHQALGQDDQAIDYLQQALEIYTGLGFKPGVGKVQTNLANVYHSLARYQKAYAHYETAEMIFNQVGDQLLEAMAQFERAVILRSLQQIREARKLLLKVEPVFERCNDTEGVFLVKIELANLDIELQRYPTAIEQLQALLPQLEEQQLAYPAFMVRQYLARCHLNLHQPAQAEGYLQQDSDYRGDDIKLQLLDAHLAYENRQLEKAAELASEIRDQAGSRWLPSHQTLLEGYQTARQNNQWTELLF